jgi:hypothetical protein
MAEKQELHEVVAQVRKYVRTSAFKNPEFGKLWETIADLVEKSDYGEKEADAELVLPPEHSNWHDQFMDESFDGTAMQLLQLANQCLGSFGEVTVNPYSRGLHTRSAILTFRPKK